MKNLLFTFALLVVLINQMEAQSIQNYFQNGEITPSTCGDDNGSISIDPPPFWISFEWDNGSNDTKLENLAPGDYSITGENEKGCIESITYNVPNIDCDIELNVQLVRRGPGCIYASYIFTLNGVEVPHNLLNVSWDVTEYTPYYPGYTNYTATTRIVTFGHLGGEATLSISLIGGEEITCCNFTETIVAPAPKECKGTQPPVYVYKSNFADPINEPYVAGIIELLVVGEGVCGEDFDLRGYIIDDNNGELIQPNELSIIDGGAGINIKKGYIKFSDNENWSNVPVGSIITIYNPRHKLNLGSGLESQEDPTDANEDFNYIVSGEDGAYFDGYMPEWDFIENEYPYTGEAASLSWDLIAPSGGGGAVQVRYPDGEYCHGVSFGKTDFSSEENDFILYLNETEFPFGRIQMNQLSFLNASSFEIQEVNGAFDPGIITSNEMIGITNYLRNCDSTLLPLVSYNPTNNNIISLDVDNQKNISLNNMLKNEIIIYPNPFKDILNIEYKSVVKGKGQLVFYNSHGSEVYRRSIECSTTNESIVLDLGKALSDGLYLIQFQPPMGDYITKRVMLIRTY